MTDTEKLLFLIRVLKKYAEAKHCYDKYGVNYAPAKCICFEYAFDDGVEYGEINFARTLLEQIGETFNSTTGPLEIDV
jgi:hypothetical protein